MKRAYIEPFMSSSKHLHSVKLIWSRAVRASAYLKAHGFGPLFSRTIQAGQYSAWVKSSDTISQQMREEMKQQLLHLSYQPLISIVLPLYDTPETLLREAIDSVCNQLYSNWELCIADDNSADIRVREIVKEYAHRDPRILHRFGISHGGISRTTNLAAEQARGEYIAFLDHDDILREHALFTVVSELNRSREVDLLFSDEDRLTARGARHKPYFKSGWNPELMLSHNAVCHLMVIRTALFRDLGGMRAEYDGAQDWDLVLRVSEAVADQRIRHIPKILYHWREAQGSTARGVGVKPYVRAAQERAVAEHLRRRGDQCLSLCALEYTSIFRPLFALPQPHPKVSIILLGSILRTKFLSKTMQILTDTSYRNSELVVVDTDGDAEGLRALLRRTGLQESWFRVVSPAQDGNPARAFNYAVGQAAGSVVCLMRSVMIDGAHDWLQELVVQAVRADVGAVGPKLLDPSGAVKSLGLSIDSTGIKPLYQGLSARHPGDTYRALVAHNVSAISADCLVMRRAIFEEVGGFDDVNLPRSLFDVDMCLKLRDTGRRIVCTPRATVTVASEPEEIDARSLAEIKTRHLSKCECDPFCNPHLTPQGGPKGLMQRSG